MEEPDAEPDGLEGDTDRGPAAARTDTDRHPQGGFAPGREAGDDYWSGRLDRQRNHAAGGDIQPLQADTGGPGGNAAARHPPGAAGPLARHRRGNHRGGHCQPDAHGVHFRGIQAAIHLPRGGVQARADDGGQRVGVHPDKRGGNAHRSGPGGEVPGGEVRDDLDGQGGEPDERDGVLETHL